MIEPDYTKAFINWWRLHNPVAFQYSHREREQIKGICWSAWKASRRHQRYNREKQQPKSIAEETRAAQRHYARSLE